MTSNSNGKHNVKKKTEHRRVKWGGEGEVEAGRQFPRLLVSQELSDLKSRIDSDSKVKCIEMVNKLSGSPWQEETLRNYRGQAGASSQFHQLSYHGRQESPTCPSPPGYHPPLSVLPLCHHLYFLYHLLSLYSLSHAPPPLAPPSPPPHHVYLHGYYFNHLSTNTASAMLYFTGPISPPTSSSPYPSPPP